MLQTKDNARQAVVRSCRILNSLIGTLRFDNGDVHEKTDSASFHFFRDYSKWLCYLKEGNLIGAEEKGPRPSSDRDGSQNLSACCSRSQVNLKFGNFTSQLCRDCKEMYKKA